MNRKAGFTYAAAAAVAIAALAPASASAQQRPGIALEKRWPSKPSDALDEAPGSSRQQQPQTTQSTATESPATPESPKGIRPQPAPPRVVACSGVFAKDSSHLKLATFFGADAITWGQVAGPESSKLDASILYPKDPRRRLEVLWNNASGRSDTQLIVINGRSTWSAPHGLKLGAPIATVEKINKKPFTLRAFSGENGGYVTSWNDGALASLPGGCKISIRFAPDPKAKSRQSKPDAALEGDNEYPSGHAGMKAASPRIAEIIIGY